VIHAVITVFRYVTPLLVTLYAHCNFLHIATCTTSSELYLQITQFPFVLDPS